MIEHIVLVEIPSAAEPQTDQILAMFQALKGVIPGVIDSTSGLDFSGRCAPFSVAAIMRFESRDALAGYQTHPAHLELVALLNKLDCKRIVADFHR